MIQITKSQKILLESSNVAFATCNLNESHKATILVTITEIWDLANPKLIQTI